MAGYPTGPAYTPGATLIGTAAGSDPAMDGAVGANLVTKAYELAAWGTLRPELIFDQFATVRATRQSHRGSSEQFTFIADLAEAVTPLAENLDVDSAAINSTTVEVGMAEYGNAVTTTALLRGTSMIPFDPVAAERVGYNAAQSVNTLARTALDATQAGFDVGTRTIVDVLISQRNLYQSITNYYQARYDYLLNVMRLKQAAGTLQVQDLENLEPFLVARKPPEDQFAEEARKEAEKETE